MIRCSRALLAIFSMLFVTMAFAEGQQSQSIETDGAAGDTERVLPERSAHTGVQQNLFRGHSWYTPPPPPPMRAAPVATPRRPVAPPLPYKLLGSYEEAGSPTIYFLVKADRIYDVVIGDTLDETYNVDGISNGKLMFTYLPLKTSQGLRLGEKK